MIDLIATLVAIEAVTGCAAAAIGLRVGRSVRIA